jgi:hypothetical protein
MAGTGERTARVDPPGERVATGVDRAGSRSLTARA